MACERAVLLPPTLIDQSFPRDLQELNKVAESFGELEKLSINIDLKVVTTDLLIDFLIDFQWQRDAADGYQLLNEVYAFLLRFLSAGSDRSICVTLAGIGDAPKHPLPIGCTTQGNSELWQDEVGKLLVLHDKVTTKNHFFLGVMCHHSFAEGKYVGSGYQNANARAFPLIGPDTIYKLDPIRDWDVREEDIKGLISVNMAQQNINLIGGHIVDPRESSHQKVRFKGKRPWVLDYNVDPIPERFLRQLLDKTDFPYEVIRFALLHGRMPTKRCRIPIQPEN